MKKMLFAMMICVLLFGLNVYANAEIETNTELENSTEAIDEAIDAVENIVNDVVEQTEEFKDMPFGNLLEKISDSFIGRFFRKIIDAVTNLLYSIFEAASGATTISEIPI